LQPDVFRRVYEHFKGKKVPDTEFFAHTLMREFSVPREVSSKFIEVFTANMASLGLVRDGQTGKWLATDVNGTAQTAANEPTANVGPQELEVSTGAKPVQSASASTVEAFPQPRREPRNAIFVGHGKNKVALQQLEKILNEYKLPYKVA